MDVLGGQVLEILGKEDEASGLEGFHKGESAFVRHAAEDQLVQLLGEGHAVQNLQGAFIGAAELVGEGQALGEDELRGAAFLRGKGGGLGARRPGGEGGLLGGFRLGGRGLLRRAEEGKDRPAADGQEDQVQQNDCRRGGFSLFGFHGAPFRPGADGGWVNILIIAVSRGFYKAAGDFPPVFRRYSVGEQP